MKDANEKANVPLIQLSSFLLFEDIKRMPRLDFQRILEKTMNKKLYVFQKYIDLKVNIVIP